MPPVMRPLFLAFCLGLAACRGQASADPSPSPLAWERASLTIETATGSHRFEVDVADDDAERERGLMYRTEMAPNAGMVFDYHREQNITMWMKNTVLPLDMVFISQDGHVFDAVKGTVPYSLELIPSGGPVRAVLELNAGTIDRIGLKRGDMVRAKMFGNAP